VALIIASDPLGEVADALLEERLYGRVEVLGDAELFLLEEEMERAGHAALTAATGGWPVLVDAALAGREAAARALLPDFLRVRVLPTLPEDLAVALLATATATAAEAAADAADRLPGAWPHPLLRTAQGSAQPGARWVGEALQSLRAQRAGLPARITARLVDRQLRRADAPAAIAHLLNLGLKDEALAVFEGAGGAYFGFRHGFGPLEALLNDFGAPMELRHESLLLARLMLLFKAGQTREALRRLDAHYPRLPVDLRRLQTSHRAYPILMRIDIAVDLDEALSVEVVTSWGRLDAFLPVDDHLARGILFNTMTLGFLRLNKLVQARQLADEALGAYQRAQSPYLVHFMHVHLADIALRQGQLHAVAEHLRRAEAQLRVSGLRHNSEQAILEAFGAHLAYEEGRFVDCPPVDPILASLVGGDCWPGLMRTILAYAPLVAFWRSGLGAGIAQAEQCLLALGRRHGTTQESGLSLLRIRLYQLAQRHAEAAAMLRERDLAALWQHSTQEAIEVRLIGLRAKVLQQTPADTAAAATQGLAQELAQLPDLTLRQRITLHLLQAYQHHRQADHGPARRHLLVALRAAQAHSCIGVLLEDAEILERLLPGLVDERDADNTSVSAFAGRLLARLRRLPGTAVRSRDVGITRQEHRVLLHCAEGAANKEIARVLGLSESAVKFHLRNLFRKLQVARRADLLDQARGRGLLPGGQP
jgi:DNA-binding CsgD family transcriptional regulator